LVDVEAVKAAKFKVDGVNSSGGIIPKLLVEVVKLYCEPNGHFHTTRAFKEHLTDISELVVKEKRI
jgi:phosphomannomutase